MGVGGEEGKILMHELMSILITLHSDSYGERAQVAI